MSTTRVLPAAGPLRGRTRVPGDKSISHRALLFGALGEGTSHVRGLSSGEDVRATTAALGLLGAEIEIGATTTVLGGRSRLVEPAAVIDLGNSGTGMRLLCGVAASLPFLSVLAGDASLHTRPMDRVVEPLRAMGAQIDGRAAATRAPLAIRGGDLHGVAFAPKVASAQVKSAILLAGLAASGETVVREPVATRRHTEEFLERCGAHVTIEADGVGQVVAVRAGTLRPFDLDVPGDPSQAAFLCVAASIVPGSDLRIENVYVGPGRSGFVSALAEMGADLEVEMSGPTTADLHVRHAPLRGIDVGGALVPDLIDEIPALCVAAAFAEGSTRFFDASELRVKESDRIATMADALGALGARVRTRADGLEIDGGRGLGAGSVDAVLDHRIAMSMAVAALGATGAVDIAGFETVASSWPGFLEDLAGLQ